MVPRVSVILGTITSVPGNCVFFGFNNFSFLGGKVRNIPLQSYWRLPCVTTDCVVAMSRCESDGKQCSELYPPGSRVKLLFLVSRRSSPPLSVIDF